MTPGGFDDGERSVVLDPSVAAALLGAIAGLEAIDQAASPLVTLTDDPTAPGAYGGFAFDDAGEPAAPRTLVDAGRPVPGPARARRPGHTGLLQPSTSHLALAPGPGTAPLSALYAGGFVLEGGLGAIVVPGPGGGAASRAPGPSGSPVPSGSGPGPGPGPFIRLACARARELHAGSMTGRVYADVELVAPLHALLAAIDAIAHEPLSFRARGDDPSAPRWRSISTPALRTRGIVRRIRT